MSLSTPIERLEPVLRWIDEHKEEAVAMLQQFCRQPSVSTQNWGMEDMILPRICGVVKALSILLTKEEKDHVPKLLRKS